MQVFLHTNAVQVADSFRRLRERQLPFATAVALTRTAKDARTAFQRSLSASFQARSPAFQRQASTRVGVTTHVWADKRDWPNVAARVAIKPWAGFLVLQEHGGRKRPERGAKTVAVPTDAVKRTASGKVPARLKPSAIFNRRGYVADGALFERKGRRLQRSKRSRRRRKGGKTVAMFLLRKSTRIKPALRMKQVVFAAAASVYQGHFRREFAEAIRKAKPKAGDRFGGR